MESRIQFLESEVYRLREEIAWLKGDSPDEQDHAIRKRLGLRPKEFQILTILRRRGALSHDQIINAVWGKEGGPDSNSLHAQICTMRKKLKPYGIRIETMWGKGFVIPEDSAQKLQAGH